MRPQQASEEAKRTFPSWRTQRSDCDWLVSVRYAVQEVVHAVLAARKECDCLHRELFGEQEEWGGERVDGGVSWRAD